MSNTVSRLPRDGSLRPEDDGEEVVVAWWLELSARDRADVERSLLARWLYSTVPARGDHARVPTKRRFPQPPITETERRYLGLE